MKHSRSTATIMALTLTLSLALTAQETSRDTSAATTSGQITVRSHPPGPLFKSKQGKQKTAVYYDPASRTVTLKLLVQTPSGYFIPDLHPDNFAVFENGVRQQNVQVRVEHAPVTLGLLMEYGGRLLSMNKALGMDVTSAAHQLLSILDPTDRVQAWTYGDTVHKITGSPVDGKTLDMQLLGLGAPSFSEADLYDALLFVVAQMKPVSGQKAIVLVSSGINTFSNATYQDVLANVGNSDSPVYVLGLTTILHDYAETHGQAGSVALIAWQKAERELEEIATTSGGRAYFPENTIDLSPIYDDMMENLKVRYVVTYKPSTTSDPNTPRTVRVELIDPATGKPLRIVDENGKPLQARVIAPESYIPAQASRH